MGFYPPHTLTHDAKRHGVTVLPPDINASGATCTVEANALRIGFSYVNGIGKEAAKSIADERSRNGDFVSLADFVRRMSIRSSSEDGALIPTDAPVAVIPRPFALNDRDLSPSPAFHPPSVPAFGGANASATNRRPPSLREEAIEHLIQTGAFDAFGLNRREMLWQLGLLYRPPSLQMPLPLPVQQDFVPLEDMNTWEQMTADYRLLSLSPGHHPMALIRPYLGESLPSLLQLRHIEDGTRLHVPGMVVCRQQPGTAKGFVFLLLEDEFGMVNVIVPPWLHERQRSLVRGEAFVIVEGELQRKEGTVNVLAQRFQKLPVPHAMQAPPSHDFG
jgi:error-prone DNA polymerase